MNNGRLGSQEALLLENVELFPRGLIHAFGEVDHEGLRLRPVDLRLPGADVENVRANVARTEAELVLVLDVL